MGEGRMRGRRVNIVPRQEVVEEKRAGTAARGVRVGEVVRGSGVEEGGLAAASHMTVREGEHVERGCAAGVGARAAAGRGDSAAAEEQGTAGLLSYTHAQPAPTCADVPVLGAVTPGSAPTLGATHPWSHAPFSVGSHRSAHAVACASMEGHLRKEPSLLVFSGTLPLLPLPRLPPLPAPIACPPPLLLYMLTCTSLCGAGAGLVPPCVRGAVCGRRHGVQRGGRGAAQVDHRRGARGSTVAASRCNITLLILHPTPTSLTQHPSSAATAGTPPATAPRARQGRMVLVLNGSLDREIAGMAASDFVLAICNCLNRTFGDDSSHRLTHSSMHYVTHLIAPEGGAIPLDHERLTCLGVTSVTMVPSLPCESSTGVHYDVHALVTTLKDLLTEEMASQVTT
ncbi:unnamed protein product [Closterium sp. NIES-54]